MTNEEIAAYNDALEALSWARLDEDRLCMDADSYNDAQGCSVEFEEPCGADEYYEPDFEDDESAMTSAGMGEDESYGYLDNEPFYYDEQ